MQHGAKHIQLILQYRIGFMGIDRRTATTTAGGVLLDGTLELVGDTDLIDLQPTLLVFEYPIDSGNRLNQVYPSSGMST